MCSHVERFEIESTLISGTESFRGIARQWGLSSEAVRRHVRAHVSPAAQSAMSAVVGLTPLSIASRMLDIADSARDERVSAAEAGHSLLALQAGRAEAYALTKLADRLGITEGAALADLNDMEAVAITLARIARSDRATGEALAAHFDESDRPDIASSLRSLFQEQRKAVTS